MFIIIIVTYEILMRTFNVLIDRKSLNLYTIKTYSFIKPKVLTTIQAKIILIISFCCYVLIIRKNNSNNNCPLKSTWTFSYSLPSLSIIPRKKVRWEVEYLMQWLKNVYCVSHYYIKISLKCLRIRGAKLAC